MIPASSKFTDYSLLPFFEQNEALLCIAGYDGYFKKINPGLTNLLGYSEEELLSQPINFFIHPEDQELTSQNRDNIRTGKPLLNFENRYITKSGKSIWFLWTSIAKPDQEIIYAIAKNITPRKLMEVERNRVISDLTHSNTQLKQFSYSSSHDLRSPLTSILLIFEMMDLSNIHDKETRDYIDLLEIATINLKNTLDLQIDQMKEERALQVPIETVIISEILEKVQETLQVLIKDSNTRLQIEFDAFDTLAFNSHYLHSILLNLLSNSIKYAHPNRDPVITIKTTYIDGIKRLIFSDNGIGFDSEKQKDNVFGLNQSFHEHMDSKGIGLYLVYNHITNMGGRITVNSKIGEGTTFTLTFLN